MIYHLLSLSMVIYKWNWNDYFIISKESQNLNLLQILMLSKVGIYFPRGNSNPHDNFLTLIHVLFYAQNNGKLNSMITKNEQKKKKKKKKKKKTKTKTKTKAKAKKERKLNRKGGNRMYKLKFCGGKKKRKEKKRKSSRWPPWTHQKSRKVYFDVTNGYIKYALLSFTF